MKTYAYDDIESSLEVILNLNEDKVKEFMDTLTPVTRTTPYPDRERIRMELWKESFLACQGDDKSGFATYALAAFDKQFPNV